MSHASFWERLVRGTRWTWLAEPYRAALPADLEATVMGLESRDRLHAKQGRSTARVHFHTGDGPLSVYLKRHYRLPWRSRLAALVDPGGRIPPRRRNGRTSNGPGRWGSTCPRSSPRASGSARGGSCRAS